MPRKFTQEDVIDNLESLNTGYDFSQFNYVNNRTKSTVTCDKGHSYEVSYDTFMSGCRCPYCSGRHHWTQEEAIANLEALNTGYDFSQFKYVNKSTESIVTCDKGHTYEVSYNTFMNGHRCPYCSGRHHWTQEEAIANLEALNTGYDFSQFKYVNSSKNSIVTCDKGHTYEVSYNTFISGCRCPYCSPTYHWTQEEAISNLKSLNTGYDFSQFKYINAMNKSIVTCDKGHTYKIAYITFMRGTRCPYCSSTYHWTQEEAISNLKSLNTGYDFSQFKYINATSKSTVTCDKGHTYEAQYSNFINGARCPYCAGHHQWSPEEAISNLESLNTGYDFSQFKYINTKTKSTVTCNKGHIYDVTYNDFMQGIRCPHCNNFKGEIFIHKWLDTHQIQFTFQKTFDDLRHKDPLKYDFFVPSCKTLIEYNGIQHYEPVDFFGGKEQFKKQVKHDKMKRKYAKKNGYKFLEIPYTEYDNLDIILTENLL